MPETVAPLIVPDRALQVVLLVNDIAPEQLSFSGVAELTTQILKPVPLPFVPDGSVPLLEIRTRYVVPIVNPACVKLVADAHAIDVNEPHVALYN